MNILNPSWHFTVGSRNNVKQESLKSTPTKTSIDSRSYYSQGLGIQSYDDSSPWEIFSGGLRWGRSLSKEKLQRMRETWLDSVIKWRGSEILPVTEDVFQSSLLTTEKRMIGPDMGSINPGATPTSITCSSLSAGVLGLPTVNKANWPTVLTPSIDGHRSQATDSSIQKFKEQCAQMVKAYYEL